MRSLVARIALALALAQLALLALATLFAWRTGARVLTDQFDQGLRNKAAAFVALIEQEGTRVSIDRSEGLALAPPEGAPLELVTVWGPNGVRIFRSPALEDRALPKLRGEPGEVLIEDRVVEGRSMRLLGMRVPAVKVEGSLWAGKPESPALVTVVLARDRGDLERSRAMLLAGLLAGDALLLVSVVLIAWLVARRGLAPLRSFGREVGALDVQTLGGSFDPVEHPRELEPVVAGLNDLRRRVDQALRREKRLNATLAHEFRTPISELRAMTSVALDDLDDAEFTRRALEQVHQVSGRLTELLDLIRRMVHLEQERVTLEEQEVDLGQLVSETLAPHADLIRARDLRWTATGLDGLRVRVNHCALASVVANLVSNALHYAPEGARVRCAARRSPDELVLSITNPCHDLTAHQIEHLTEPFWRGSSARSDPDHHGLGLTIAQGMASLARLELRLTVREETFQAEVVWPTSRS